MLSSNSSLLAWYEAFGVDALVSINPQNLFELSKQTASKAPKHIRQDQERQTQESHTSTPMASSVAVHRVAPTAIHETSQSARDLAAQAQTLEDLRQAMMAFEGCALKHTATNMVFGVGNPKARVMLVGEAPGADEDRQGIPFVGMSGQLLDKMLAAINLSRETVYISNVVPWRPPGNRQPTTNEIAVCHPFIERHISFVKPDILVCVGGTAVKALLDITESMTKLRGRWLEYQNPFLSAPIKTTAIFHPAYLLRSPGQKRQAWQDMLRLEQTLKEQS